MKVGADSESTARSDRPLAPAPVLAATPSRGAPSRGARRPCRSHSPPGAVVLAAPSEGTPKKFGTCSCLAGDSNPVVRAGGRCGRSTQIHFCAGCLSRSRVSGLSGSPSRFFRSRVDQRPGPSDRPCPSASSCSGSFRLRVFLVVYDSATVQGSRQVIIDRWPANESYGLVGPRAAWASDAPSNMAP